MLDDMDDQGDLVRRSLRDLSALRREMIASVAARPDVMEAVAPERRLSAANLIHYLTLRAHDVRGLQDRLASLGLSSLGRAEPHVLATVDAVLTVLHRLDGRRWVAPADDAPEFQHGSDLLARQAERLLGAPVRGRRARIMVTMPTEAADDYGLVRDLVGGGMNCMRINCAHDNRTAWAAMIGQLRRAEADLGVRCSVLMDLAGPKLRTGPIRPGPAVLKVRPRRDVFGRVTSPARVWLSAAEAPAPPPSAADASLTVSADWLVGLEAGHAVSLMDARGARRVMTVADVSAAGAWLLATKTAYLTAETHLRNIDLRDARFASRETAIGEVPPGDAGICLAVGDRLVLQNSPEPGREASRDPSGAVLSPAVVGCSPPEIFEQVKAGEPIWFDDGKIGGTVERVAADHLDVRITQAPAAGATLRADRGINLPDSALDIPSLTAKDLEDLEFVVDHADMVALSFVSRAEDVRDIERRIREIGRRAPALVLKIETRRGFDHLPEMLLEAMRAPCAGVMIARGDLAVECGFERLAEVQEEILWIAEAAHVPVIWATQVLESLAKSGMASRAEVTDAAMAHRAECVMLNKGPHIRDAVRALDDILRRMEAHQHKKRALLRPLKLASHWRPPAALDEK